MRSKEIPRPYIAENYVKKGWGYEQWITNNEEYCGKLLFFKKGKKCSLHKHVEKREHFFVGSGKLLIRVSWEEDLDMAQEFVLTRGMCYEVPRGLIHQMEALEDTELFEFSTTHYDEDSYRIVKGD